MIDREHQEHENGYRRDVSRDLSEHGSVRASRSAPAAVLLRGKGFGDWQALRKSSVDRRFMSAEMTRPLRDGHGQPVMGDDVVVRPVILLGLHRRPAAVPGRVISTRVDAVERQSLRPRTHVGEEALERPAPFRTHGNAPGPVLGEVGIARAVASADHASPRSIGRRAGLAVRRIALDTHRTMNVAVEAPARPRRAFNQASASHDAFGSALAAAKPLRLVVAVVFDAAEDGPATERAPGNINECRHDRIMPRDAGIDKRGLTNGQ